MKRIPLWFYAMVLWSWSTMPGFHLDVIKGSTSFVIVFVIFWLKTRKAVYIGGSLTGLQGDDADLFKRYYEQLARVCSEQGFSAYVPHKHTDPLKHPNVPPMAVFWLDCLEIFKANLLIMSMDRESFGVGVELMVAWLTGTRVVMVYQKDKRISRMALGCPSVYHRIEYNFINNAAFDLAHWLVNYRRHYLRQALHMLPSQYPHIPRETAGL